MTCSSRDIWLIASSQDPGVVPGVVADPDPEDPDGLRRLLLPPQSTRKIRLYRKLTGPVVSISSFNILIYADIAPGFISECCFIVIIIDGFTHGAMIPWIHL